MCPVCSSLTPYGAYKCLAPLCAGKWHSTVQQYVAGEGFVDITKPRLTHPVLMPRVPLGPLQPADQSTFMPLISPVSHGVPMQHTGFAPLPEEPLSSTQPVVDAPVVPSQPPGSPARTVYLKPPVSQTRPVSLKRCKPPPPTARHGSVPKVAMVCAASPQTIEQPTTAIQSSFVPFPPRMLDSSTQTDSM